jgi:hypothetical protein
MEGKLTNAEGEFIASGPCEFLRDRGEVTMWPSWELHMLERERGELTLELEDGARLAISDKHLTFKLRGNSEQRISVYRLRIIERASVPEHLAAGYQAKPQLEIVPPTDEQAVYEDVSESQAAPPA